MQLTSCIWETFAHVSDYQKQLVGLGEKWRGQRQPTSMILQVFLLFPFKCLLCISQHLM